MDGLADFARARSWLVFQYIVLSESRLAELNLEKFLLLDKEFAQASPLA